MYEGSMVGMGPEFFAVWPYVIACADIDGNVELNPIVIGAKIGMKSEAVEKVIDKFMQPDPRSRSKVMEGRKLERIGEFTYRIVNYEFYRSLKRYEDRREQNRLSQAAFRERKAELKVFKRSKPLAGEVAAIASGSVE